MKRGIKKEVLISNDGANIDTKFSMKSQEKKKKRKKTAIKDII